MALPVLSRPRPAVTSGPFREAADLYERVASLWGPGTGAAVDRWLPSADLEETDDAWSVEVELPGVRGDDVDVVLEDSLLTVSGEVREKERAGILRRRTRRVGEFQFAVALPGEVDAEHVEASLHDGVLTVRLPKAPGTQRRHIRVAG